MTPCAKAAATRAGDGVMGAGVVTVVGAVDVVVTRLVARVVALVGPVVTVVGVRVNKSTIARRRCRALMRAISKKGIFGFASAKICRNDIEQLKNYKL